MLSCTSSITCKASTTLLSIHRQKDKKVLATAPSNEAVFGVVGICRKGKCQQDVKPHDVERKDAVVREVRGEPGAPLLERLQEPRDRLLSGTSRRGAFCVPSCGAVSVPAIVALPQ
jgi:hypothetical protein